MALITGEALECSAAGTDAILTSIIHCALIAIFTHLSIRTNWIGAGTRRWITGTNGMALITGCAGDCIRTCTYTGLTCVSASTCTAITAGHTIRLSRIRTNTGGGITGARIMTLIGGGTHLGCTGSTGAGLTSIGGGSGTRASIAITACRTVGLGRIRAHTRRRVACTHVMALVAGRAGDRIRARTYTGRAHIGSCACIAIVTCRAVGLRGSRTNTGQRVARTR